MNQHVGEHSDSISDDIIGVGGMVLIDLCRVDAAAEQNYIAIIDKSTLLSCLNPDREASEL